MRVGNRSEIAGTVRQTSAHGHGVEGRHGGVGASGEHQGVVALDASRNYCTEVAATTTPIEIDAAFCPCSRSITRCRNAQDRNANDFR